MTKYINKDPKIMTRMRLQKSIREKAKVIGNGNMSEGVRTALIKWEIKK